MSTFISDKIFLFTLFREIESPSKDSSDLNRQLVHFTLDCDMLPCFSKTKEDEAVMLATFWDVLNPIITGRFMCGWEIYDEIWPRLINRSLHHSIPIPPWAINDLAKKYTTTTLIDIANIYRQGVYQGIRPLPPLDKVIRLWTGDALKPVEDLIWASNKYIEETACGYLAAMQITAARYLNQPIEQTALTKLQGAKQDEVEF